MECGAVKHQGRPIMTNNVLRIINPPPIDEPSPEDLEIYEQALAAVPLSKIAKQRGLSLKQIDQALVKACKPFDASSQLVARSLAIARWERLTQTYYPLALQGDHASTAILCKIDERRAALSGQDVPASFRRDPVELQIEASPKETSTDKIQRILDAIRKPAIAAPAETISEPGETEAPADTDNISMKPE
jgi:hypothetical protein